MMIQKPTCVEETFIIYFFNLDDILSTIILFFLTGGVPERLKGFGSSPNSI